MTRKMKDSGVEWIGEIPEAWRILRLGQCSGQVKVSNEGLKETNLLSLSYGKIVRKNIETTFGLLPVSFESYTIVQPGDTVLRLTDLQNDQRSLRSGYVKETGIVTSAYVSLRPNRDTPPRFLQYSLHAYDIIKGFYGMGAGVRQGLNWAGIKHLGLCIPGTEEAERIADFLDAQTAEIDASIAKTQESIGEYKKLKQAVITQAVTKGIRPGRVMKDSGVEWIGEIPEEWKAAPVKHYLRLQTGTTPSSQHPEYFNGEIPWYTPGDILDKVKLTNSERTLKREAISDGIVPLYPPDSVLIVGIGATLGKTGYIDRPASSNQQITALSPRDNTCCGRYVAYCFKSMEAKLKDFAFYTTLPIINNRTLGQFRCPFPPLPEQQEIAAYLDEKCAAIDTLIEKKQAIITELEAYKKSLIYEYVTGKKEVPMASC